MEPINVMNHITVLDLVMVARKSAIDRMGIYTEVPTDPVDISLWMSTVIRKYTKQLFSNCYVRKNRYAFSIRLDTPEFAEMYPIIVEGYRIPTKYYLNQQQKSRVASVLSMLQDSIRNTRSGATMKVRPDNKIFLYIPHTTRVYERNGCSFMKSLEYAESTLATWKTIYENIFPEIRNIIEEAKNNKDNRKLPNQNVSIFAQSVPSTENINTIQETPVVRPVIRHVEEVDETPRQPIITPVSRTVNEAEQNRFNDILRRMTGRNQDRETNNDEETAITLTETRYSIAHDLRMLPPCDYIINLDGEAIVERGEDDIRTITNADDIIREVSNTDLPDTIPTVNIQFSNEYMYELGNDVEKSITEGPNGIYYVPEPMYYVVIDNNIVDKFVNLDSALEKYELLVGSDDDITILYPVTELNLRDERYLRSAISVPSDVSNIYYDAIEEETDRMVYRENNNEINF